MNSMAMGLMAVIPGLFILRGMAARIDVYDAFLKGAGDGMKTAFSILPALTGMMLMLGMMHASGLTEALTCLLAPVLSLFRLPEEVAPLMLLRPVTGSGSMAALEEIFASCGADSRAGRIASVLMSSSETIFYTMTVYLGATDVRHLPWAVPVSLLAYLAGAASAGLMM